LLLLCGSPHGLVSRLYFTSPPSVIII
jgi:hypothetical protein